MKTPLTLSFCFALLSGIAQLPYTQNDFTYTVETDVEYGTVINYAGIEDTLLMDIYKPIGDNNCNRPCMVLVHGGSWIGGSKEDASIVSMAQKFAEKGWVVSTINYRLGTHKTSSYTMYAVCNDDISEPCGYIADSAEVFRANYRGQQDAKGAIRFMKNRYMLDSTDVNNFFITGESAGAFISYAAVFMDKPSEKPTFCNAMAAAPTPDADLVFCLPAGYSLERPDLGDVEGTLNIGGFDASVEGVGSFYGAMMNFDMIAGDTEWPVMYMFHQGSDVVVNYNYGKLLGRIDWECYSPTNLCQNYAKYPRAFGSKGIENYFSGLTSSPDRTVDIIENYEYTNDCFDNGHSIDGLVLRSNNLIEKFAERIAANGNTPSATCVLGNTELENMNINLFPNPSSGKVEIKAENNEQLNLVVYSAAGQVILDQNFNQNTSLVLPTGVYYLRITSIQSENQVVKKLVVL